MYEELIYKAKAAKSAQEISDLAKENGIEMTEESANAYFEQLQKSGELADDELDNVAGGWCYHDGNRVITPLSWCTDWKCSECGSDDYQRLNETTGCYLPYCRNWQKRCTGIDVRQYQCRTCGIYTFREKGWKTF